MNSWSSKNIVALYSRLQDESAETHADRLSSLSTSSQQSSISPSMSPSLTQLYQPHNPSPCVVRNSHRATKYDIRAYTSSHKSISPEASSIIPPPSSTLSPAGASPVFVAKRRLPPSGLDVKVVHTPSLPQLKDKTELRAEIPALTPPLTPLPPSHQDRPPIAPYIPPSAPSESAHCPSSKPASVSRQADKAHAPSPSPSPSPAEGKADSSNHGSIQKRFKSHRDPSEHKIPEKKAKAPVAQFSLAPLRLTMATSGGFKIPMRILRGHDESRSSCPELPLITPQPTVNPHPQAAPPLTSPSPLDPPPPQRPMVEQRHSWTSEASSKVGHKSDPDNKKKASSRSNTPTNPARDMYQSPEPLLSLRTPSSVSMSRPSGSKLTLPSFQQANLSHSKKSRKEDEGWEDLSGWESNLEQIEM